MAKTEKYWKEPDSAQPLLDEIMDLTENGVIDPELGYALNVAVNHQIQLDYDALAEAYRGSPKKVQRLMKRAGVILTFTEDQVKAVKQ